MYLPIRCTIYYILPTSRETGTSHFGLYKNTVSEIRCATGINTYFRYLPTNTLTKRPTLPGKLDSEKSKLFLELSAVNFHSITDPSVETDKKYCLSGLTTSLLASVAEISSEANYEARGNTKREVAICSASFTRNTESHPYELSDLIRYCEGIGLPLLVGCDSNSHHTMWGDMEVKPRGRMLLEFLTLRGMQVANRGSVPTYFTPERQSVIDLTLCSTEFLSQVLSWKVSLEVSLSDHRHIFFELDESIQLIENGYRNPRTTQWDLYLEDLKGRLIGIPSRYESEADVEVVLNRLNSAIVELFEANCPLKQRTSSSKTPWWNFHVESHRRKPNGQKILTTGRITNPPRGEYKKVIRDSIRNTWWASCEDIIQLPSAARLSKVLTKDPGAKLDAVSLPDGGYTFSAGETLQHLLSVHFPGFTGTTATEDDNGSKIGDKAVAGVYGKTTRTKLSFALGFFQAEIYAILACGMGILKTAPKRRTNQICTDSQAALMAIESSKVKLRLVLDCKRILNDLASRNRVILTWVPGHSGVPGNEEANRLARVGSIGHPIGPEPILGVPYSMGVSTMKELLRSLKSHGKRPRLSII
ncbi:hypothetical protein NQ318_018317 [Aromia moschata]|uniref:RNase H type-1 domain-containing protein n=1 Tax=Aromia moschata TaxID=1265417 RepID=A0AAV8ZDQ5_9CUCU|nr:hypothetical protein NQ318_018317 [Aromia moschata]